MAEAIEEIQVESETIDILVDAAAQDIIVEDVIIDIDLRKVC